ncbi:LysR family transcriptional regulator [Endozoicomonas sp. G2_1]|uniref:LysR family transcriptional regulator n=1 Tax=Endozoicomonas sp. G2_1 TaxID=2821091 RepID=UPI001AD989AC|nr:LysR family transcriptional regulator [Endozoicomonas sp. G2_1]MBO9488905.1 LysR family transcriptional regulator [Endozoicomonas sp. G2_1]
MKIRQLKYFIALAEELHFLRAARRLHLTQPALSYQLKSIESQLNVQLIERDRRSVKLTEAGKYFYEGAQKIIKDLNTLERTTQEKSEITQPKLTIGFAEYLNLDIVLSSILATKAVHPNIVIQQLDLPTHRIFDAVKEREIDIGFALLPALHPTLKYRPIVSGKWGIVLPANHPLAQQKNISLKDINNLPCVFFNKAMNPQLYQWWMKKFDNAGVSADIILQPKQVSTALRMVANESAAFIVADYVVSDLPTGLVHKPFNFENNQPTIGAAWHENNSSKALQLYLNELRLKLESDA